jgi:hypothetical protein
VRPIDQARALAIPSEVTVILDAKAAIEDVKVDPKGSVFLKACNAVGESELCPALCPRLDAVNMLRVWTGATTTAGTA